MDLFLIRHGETDANLNGIVQGWFDTELNDNGHVQALEAATSFNEKIEAIYSSDLKRSSQTAKKFRDKYPHIHYSEDSRLRERNFGDANGGNRDDYDWDLFWSLTDTVSVPNAETLNEFSQRIQSFLDTLKETGHSSVLIITHGGTINRIRHLVNGDAYKQHTNGSVTKIRLT